MFLLKLLLADSIINYNLFKTTYYPIIPIINIISEDNQILKYSNATKPKIELLSFVSTFIAFDGNMRFS